MRNNDAGRDDLGPWDGDAFRETMRATAGVGSDTGLPDAVRFCRGIGRLIRRRLEACGGDIRNDGMRPAVFLFQPKPPGGGPSTKRIPMLNNGQHALTGRLWFVPREPNCGHYCEWNADSDSELFRVVVEDYRLGGVPAVIVDPRTDRLEARFYPRGLGHEELCNAFPIGPGAVTMAAILQKLDDAHRAVLVVPSKLPAEASLWHDSTTWRPSRRAEKMIQMHLRTALSTTFTWCDIPEETDLTAGRTDLEIVEQDRGEPSKRTHHALLELKVLRSFSHSGRPVSARTNEKNVSDGLEQAREYSSEIGTRATALCCFDMQKKHTGIRCFANIEEQARELDITLRVWPVFSSALHYRLNANARAGISPLATLNGGAKGRPVPRQDSGR